MQLKYDSDFCGSLPLNFINNIQSYGVLLVLEKETFRIVQCSQNTDEHLGIAHEQLVERQLSAFVTAEDIASMKAVFRPGIKEKLPFKLNFQTAEGPKPFLLLLHPGEEYWIAEIEPQLPWELKDDTFIGVYHRIKHIMAAIESADSAMQLCHLAAAALKEISGFDRVMIYQFDEDWNGLVVAEELEEGMEPYLALRFPASDIPRQARALYETNAYRLIPDRNYQAVKLYPVINPLTQTFVDLSACNLRAVAAVHLEYLQNMNAAASMSTRILVNGKLWGLISCHHRTSRAISYEMCTVFEMLSDVISSKIASLASDEQLRLRGRLQDIQSQLVEKIYREDLISALTSAEPNILTLLNAKGAVIVHNQLTETVGNVPPADTMRDLVFWLQTRNLTETYAADAISEVYDDGYQHDEIASGMIVLPIRPDKGEFLIAFRPEVVREINWGGNPHERIQFETDNKNYHPRNSFRLWQQTVKRTSLPWHSEEIAIAESFRKILVNYINQKPYA